MLGIYGGLQFFFALLLRVPWFRQQAEKCSNFYVVMLIKWVHQVLLYPGFRLLYALALWFEELPYDFGGFAAACTFAGGGQMILPVGISDISCLRILCQERYYVGRNMYERTRDYFQ